TDCAARKNAARVCRAADSLIVGKCTSAQIESDRADSQKRIINCATKRQTHSDHTTARIVRPAATSLITCENAIGNHPYSALIDGASASGTDIAGAGETADVGRAADGLVIGERTSSNHQRTTIAILVIGYSAANCAPHNRK